MWTWVLGGLLLWVLLAFAVALIIGRGIRIADGRSVEPLIGETAPTAVRLRAPRRRIPLPPVGVGLAATAVLLMTAGYVVRLTGATGSVATALSMDAPWSAPRMFVAALFAAAAVAAVVGLAQACGMHSLAEGVETADQLAMATELGCTYAQGFHIARPMPAGELTRWLAARPTLRSGDVARPAGTLLVPGR